MYPFRCRGNMNQRARAQAGSDGVSAGIVLHVKQLSQ